MKQFKIEIKETLSKVIEIDAASVEDAIENARNLYYGEQIILDHNDHLATEIEALEQEL